MKLRPYQQHAVDNAINELATNKSTLVVLPTGGGKTILFAKVAEHFMQTGRVMVIAHREELIRQAASKIKAVTNYQPSVEMADEWSAEDGFSKPKIVVSSVQTLCRGRVERFDPAEFSLLISDECFPAGTMIDGKPIEDIKIGDLVKSFNHKTGQVEIKRVITRMTNPTSKLSSIYLSNGHKIVCTLGHPFWLKEHNEYMPARLLHEGDRLTTDGGDEVVAERIFTKNCDSTTVYNIEVEDNHNYFANGVLVHNCHHSTATSYATVYNHMLSKGCKHLGVTATPDRADEQALGKVFDTVAYDYELPNIIEDGWLVPVKQRLVTVTGLDYSRAKVTAGDLNQGDVAAAQANESILHEMIDPIIEIVGKRKTIIFATPGSKKPTEDDEGFHIAERMTEIINRYKPNSARRVSQDTPKDVRRQMLLDFSAGEFQFLVNVGVLTEGFDDPSIEVVAITRPTKSRSLYSQMVGRGTRPLPGIVDQYEHAHERRHSIATSTKPHVEILDFVGNSGRHKLVNTADILGGNYEQVVIDKAVKKATEESVDMTEALKEAYEETKDEREKERRAKILAKTKFQITDVDPFDVFDLQPIRERAWDKGKPPTPAQLYALRSMGIPQKQNLTRAQAGQLLSEAYRRRDEGLVAFHHIAKGAEPGMKLTELNKDRFTSWQEKYQKIVHST